MDTTELALVRQRVADLHRDAQTYRLATAARAGRPARPAVRVGLPAAARQTVARATAWARSVRPVTTGGQVCCA